MKQQPTVTNQVAYTNPAYNQLSTPGGSNIFVAETVCAGQKATSDISFTSSDESGTQHEDPRGIAYYSSNSSKTSTEYDGPPLTDHFELSINNNVETA